MLVKGETFARMGSLGGGKMIREWSGISNLRVRGRSPTEKEIHPKRLRGR